VLEKSHFPKSLSALLSHLSGCLQVRAVFSFENIKESATLGDYGGCSNKGSFWGQKSVYRSCCEEGALSYPKSVCSPQDL